MTLSNASRLLGSAVVLFSLVACQSDTSSADIGDTAGGDATDGDAGSDAVDPGYNALWIPPTLSGTTFDLTLSETTKQLRPGAVTKTYGYNGHDFWGPTLIMKKGDNVELNVTNAIMDETTVHWHGFHIPAIMDGGPHQPIAPGATWSPAFEVKNNAATYWYHPHLHMMTLEQLSYGAGGLIIVQDDSEAALALPRTYGVDDVPLVLTSRRFSATNQFDFDAAYGDYLLANGTIDAQANLPAQLVRFRILNAEVERSYNLGFSDGRTFYVITTDGGLVDAPIPVTRLPMSVGERYEILVDLGQDAVGSTLELQAFNGGQAFGFPGGEPQSTGEFGSLLNDKTFDVLHIKVAAATEGAITQLPTSLVTNAFWSEDDVTNRRTIAITDEGPGTPFTFDNAAYDLDVINQTVALDAVEVWTLENNRTFGHSFHLHDVQFKLLSRTSGAVGSYEQGWKDVVFLAIDESVSFIARFDDFASDTNPFMYHCHMANHEDGGLMGQFLVR